MLCSCYYNHGEWPALESPAPLPDCTLKCFIQNPVHLWMAGRKESTHPDWRRAIPGDAGEINGLLTLLPHSPHL